MERDYKPIIKDVISYALIILAVILIRIFIFDPVRVDGPSMDDTLLDGQVLIINKIGYKKSNIKRYDIVVADVCIDGKLDYENCKKERVVKRVIGLPNETIYAKDGKVYVNDKEVDSSFTKGVTEDFTLDGFTKLEGDSYFLMGDNREISLDSRGFGPVKKNQIKGKASIRIWPINKIKVIK
ncbi:MAG: signal peptidase I [Bacilli bacterium]|nr:signal peptidase I [Bacilli bacterium]